MIVPSLEGLIARWPRRPEHLEQLHVRLPGGVGDRQVGDLAVDHVDAFGQPRVSRAAAAPDVSHVKDVRQRGVGRARVEVTGTAPDTLATQ